MTSSTSATRSTSSIRSPATIYDQTAEKEAQLYVELSYDTTTGELSYQNQVFFEVYEGFLTLKPADTVYFEVDGDQFAYDTVNNDWDFVA